MPEWTDGERAYVQMEAAQTSKCFIPAEGIVAGAPTCIFTYYSVLVHYEATLNLRPASPLQG